MAARWGWALLLTAGCLHAACVTSMHAQNPPDSSRDAFVQKIDRALASRDSSQIVLLADTDTWRTAGHQDLQTLKLWLPPGPLARKQGLSPNELLYEDGERNSWRLRLRHDDDHNAWVVMVLTRPCPPKGMPRGRPWEDVDATRASDAPVDAGIWTVLECWPLPK